MSNRDTAATLEYHEATKHSERSVRTSRHFLDFENQPLAFKIYRDLEAIPLSQSFPSWPTATRAGRWPRAGPATRTRVGAEGTALHQASRSASFIRFRS